MRQQENNQSRFTVAKIMSHLCSFAVVILLASLPEVASAATPWYAVGESHTVVLMKDGTVWTLGDNR